MGEDMIQKISMVLFVTFICIGRIYSQSDTLIVTLNDIPYSTKVSAVKKDNLNFGKVLVASTGSIAVTHTGAVSTIGTAISADETQTNPAKLEVTLTPASWEHPSEVGRTKKVYVVFSSDEKLYHFVDNSEINYYFQDISGANREHTTVGDKDVYTISVGGALDVSRFDREDVYLGTVTATIHEVEQ